jgi:endo-1,4-beta-D-glucanase Y
MVNDRGPSPPANGSQFPFPQNRESHYCTYPTGYQNAVVRAAYQKWKTDTVTTDGANGFRRVKRPNDSGLEANSTVSEGIGYGMIIAVYMNDQSLFDDLWNYEQQHLDSMTGLMNWYINAAGTDIGHNPDGNGPATDADEDMAWALVMADRQWGGKGSLAKAYLDTAKDVIQRIWDHEIYASKLIMPGPWGGGWDKVNPSYFAPAYYRVFAKVSGDTRWSTDVIKTVYDTITNSLNTANGNASNGLVPAWCTSDGVPNGNALATGNPTNYQYDACRTPFRIGIDYCLFGEMLAHDYAAKTSTFFSGIGAQHIVDGYDLDGGAKAQHSTGQSAAFVGPAAVGAMSAANFLPFLNDAYADLATLNLLVGGVYYDESWTMLSLLMLTGNFLDYTAY